MKKKVLISVLALVLVAALTGCSVIGAFVGKLKGELFGNDYIIRQYDDFGNLVFTIHGDIIGRLSRFLAFLFLLMGVARKIAKKHIFSR